MSRDRTHILHDPVVTSAILASSNSSRTLAHKVGPTTGLGGFGPFEVLRGPPVHKYCAPPTKLDVDSEILSLIPITRLARSSRLIVRLGWAGRGYFRSRLCRSRGWSSARVPDPSDEFSQVVAISDETDGGPIDQLVLRLCYNVHGTKKW